MLRGIVVLIAGVTIAGLGVGCRSESKREDAAPPRVAAPREPAPPREPARVGDYIVYPLKWRNPQETAFRLQALLYPKYGPFVQIVPDPDTDSLLIYLPPRESRFVEPDRAGGKG